MEDSTGDRTLGPDDSELKEEHKLYDDSTII